ncbi:MAG: pyrroloquinoline quinone biosynthesis protein PqqB [Saprospiraceae bacterium]|nr:pyrroloquinoline quinone biosynthesis protein PqqB [Saprospiraceae bacterium]
MKTIYILIILCFSIRVQAELSKLEPYLLVLGIAQDGGYPHMGCEKKCCEQAWEDNTKKRFVVSLALVDPSEKKWWLFEATPDIREQFQLFNKLTNEVYPYLPEGIFCTHAHIGHYTGLMEFGREVLNTKNLNVYVLPKMKQFLSTNGPWNQLVQLKNIVLNELRVDIIQNLNASIKILPFEVPHRDEYSETAGFKIIAKTKSYLFIPDIDKWSLWEKDIISIVKEVDYAFIDATFSEADELINRKMAEVPHPFVAETMQLFANETSETKAKIKFIHFNHTNPLLWSSKKRKLILHKGFGIAEQGAHY